MSLKTPLYDKHIEMGGKMVDFAGWQMPVHFGSQIDEHNSVRQDAGMFDVSHMAVTDLKGSDVRDMLRLLLANNVDKLQEKGKALYSCMLNSDGGILDDLIVYFLADDWFRIVSNAGTREKDIKWIENLAKDFEDLSVIERPDLAIIAVQGPNAKEKTYAALGDAIREQTESLKPFFATTVGDLLRRRVIPVKQALKLFCLEKRQPLPGKCLLIKASSPSVWVRAIHCAWKRAWLYTALIWMRPVRPWKQV